MFRVRKPGGRKNSAADDTARAECAWGVALPGAAPRAPAAPPPTHRLPHAGFCGSGSAVPGSPPCGLQGGTGPLRSQRQRRPP